MPEHLIGVHAVNEALREGRNIRRVVVVRGRKSAARDSVVEECRRRKVTVQFAPRDAIDRLARTRKHQGVVAVVAGGRAESLAAVLEQIDPPGLLLVLDGVQDPRNLGAIVRSAHAAGANAVVIPDRRSAGLTEAASKAAAGAAEHLPVVVVKNLNQALDRLKSGGFWLYGLDERAPQTYLEADFGGNVALVLGGEGEGLHRLTAAKCDFLIRIPVVGRIASLNVSVAAGVALFEVLRRRVDLDDGKHGARGSRTI